MGANDLFKIGWCVALLAAFSFMEKGQLSFSDGFSFGGSKSKPTSIWWQNSHRQMPGEDSPWVWIAHSSNSQRENNSQRNYNSEYYRQNRQPETTPSYYTIPDPNYLNNVERMRQFRMEKRREEMEIQRL